LKPPVVFAKPVTPKEIVPANDKKNDNVHADKIEVPAGPKNEVATAKKRKRPPLMDLIRENHVQYNKFINKKVPKLLKSLVMSSSESDGECRDVYKCKIINFA
jgi:hypothetical protein